MTCFDALALLDDFVDGELDSSHAGSVRDHVENCDRCHEEFLATKRLKELLKTSPLDNPSEDYWSDTTRLIMARTVATGLPTATETRTASQRSNRNDFVRSLVSLAASIAILISAVLVGQSQDQSAISVSIQGDRPVFLAHSVVEQFPGGYPELAADSDQSRLARGMLLMGMPGHLSRLALLADMMAETDREK
jgi:anti-sigma factor RsiW